MHPNIINTPGEWAVYKAMSSTFIHDHIIHLTEGRGGGGGGGGGLPWEQGLPGITPTLLALDGLPRYITPTHLGALCRASSRVE